MTNTDSTSTRAKAPAGEPYLAAHDPQRGMTVLADAARTGGALGVVIRDVEAGDNSTWCRHTAQDVAYLVLDGEIVFRAGDRTWTARPVSLLFVPQHRAHCLRASTRARFVMLAVPAGLEGFVARTAAADTADAALLLALAQEYRVEVLPDLLA